jgi:hypothetical protein
MPPFPGSRAIEIFRFIAIQLVGVSVEKRKVARELLRRLVDFVELMQQMRDGRKKIETEVRRRGARPAIERSFLDSNKFMRSVVVKADESAGRRNPTRIAIESRHAQFDRVLAEIEEHVRCVCVTRTTPVCRQTSEPKSWFTIDAERRA